MLQVRQLVKHFGGIHAVDGVSFEVAAGECVALIGPNGAGKSTCFACIAGQYPLTGGHVLWNGQALEKLPPVARLRHGVARTFQVAQVFEKRVHWATPRICLQFWIREIRERWTHRTSARLAGRRPES